jgi:hypothetical protein
MEMYAFENNPILFKCKTTHPNPLPHPYAIHTKPEISFT